MQKNWAKDAGIAPNILMDRVLLTSGEFHLAAKRATKSGHGTGRGGRGGEFCPAIVAQERV
jgi:hypothetical protein